MAELKALHPDDARQLGLGQVSERTLHRWSAAWPEQGIMGLADGRLTPVLRGHRKITLQVAEAIHAVHAECLHRSRVVLSARAMRAQDKAACERAFLGIQSLLLELLLGYRGRDVADRGADPEGDAVWTLDEMEHLLATWIVCGFTDRRKLVHRF
ncbi:hypothetical protein [Streptomyces sp. NPDC059168]|uniref:hypothetical protein n=1 Tax=Streptomyces sp. NPDC059168 TaxID=3346753 RepID=UPI0036AD25C8